MERFSETSTVIGATVGAEERSIIAIGAVVLGVTAGRLGLIEAHRKRLRTSNACENVNGQIKKRTRVVGLFPNEESLLRLVTGVLIEISESWETGKTYLTLN